MKNNKIGRYLVILLFIIVIPSTIYSIYYNNVLEREYNNPDHLDRIDNTLYFYNEADELMGFYECQNSECTLAYTSIEDEDNFENTIESQITDKYGRTVFIDDNGIKMFTMSTTSDNKEMKVPSAELDLIKDYGGALQNYFICKIKDQESYFIVDKATGTVQLNNGYKFIGSNRLVDQEKFIINNNGVYNIIGVDAYNTINNLTDRIIDYTGSYVITKNEDGVITFYDSRGEKIYLTDIEKYNVLSDYVVVKTKDGVYAYNPDLKTVLDSKTGENITYELDGDTVKYYDGKENIDTFSMIEYNNNLETNELDETQTEDGEV